MKKDVSQRKRSKFEVISKVLRVKEFSSGSCKFKAAAIAPHNNFVATGDSNFVLNIWSFFKNVPQQVSLQKLPSNTQALHQK